MPRKLLYLEPATLAAVSAQRGERHTFDFEGATIATPSPHIEDEDTDLLRRLHVLLRDRVMRRPNGSLRTDSSIVARLIVLQMLLDPSTADTLSAEARKRGHSRAWFSEISCEFSRTIGLRAPRSNGSNYQKRDRAYAEEVLTG